jgi:hypothetical protein
MTAALVAANKANARKSTGPRTELGKSRSSRNAGKHLVYAKVAVHSMKELGENPAEFEKLRESLRSTFQPQDGFEEMLVDDMTVTRWRLGRVRRAEMGILAVQQFRLEHRVRATSAKGQANYDNVLVRAFGLVGASDSPEKYLQILELLRSLRVGVEREGFTPQGLEVLQTVYGSSPGVAGVGLISQYKAQLESLESEAQTEGEEERNAARQSYQESLDREIEAFAVHARALQLVKNMPLPQAVKDSQLIPAEEEMEKILRYETALERQFERKLQQLIAWRRAKGEPAAFDGGAPWGRGCGESK